MPVSQSRMCRAPLPKSLCNCTKAGAQLNTLQPLLHHRLTRCLQSLHHSDDLGVPRNRHGSTERLVAVLSTGAGSLVDINQGDEQGWPPLMVASARGRSDIVRILLNKGANVSIAADCGVALLCTLVGSRGRLAVTEMLVEAGADLEATTPIQGETPLKIAAKRGHVEVMSVLIAAGADPDNHGLGTEAPLYIAAQEGHWGSRCRYVRKRTRC